MLFMLILNLICLVLALSKDWSQRAKCAALAMTIAPWTLLWVLPEVPALIAFAVIQLALAGYLCLHTKLGVRRTDYERDLLPLPFSFPLPLI
jgi:hypothetical protein